MNIQDQLLKLAKTLTDAKPSFDSHAKSDTLIIAGQFEGRKAQFGIRKTLKEGVSEVFFQLRITLSLNLNIGLPPNCPIDGDAESGLEDADLGLEEGIWLTERLQPRQGNEIYFMMQTPESVWGHFSRLNKLIERIEAGKFLLKKSITEFKKKSTKTVFIILAVAIVLLGFFVMYVSYRVLSGKKVFDEWNTKSTGYAKSYSGKDIEKIAARVMHKRYLNPSDEDKYKADIFMKVVPDKTFVRLGGKVTLTYWVYSSYSTRCRGLYDEGTYHDFRMEQLDTGQAITAEEVLYQGRKFTKFKAGVIVLHPEKTGLKTIIPGIVYIIVKDQNGEIVDLFLSAKPMDITVRE